jgi:hypothetical protein
MMRTKAFARISAALLALLVGSAIAADATVTGITVTPTVLKPGDYVTIKVDGKINTPGKHCHLLFLKGDGTPQSLAGNPTSFPYTFAGSGAPLWVYKNPGTYTIKVYGDMNHMPSKCDGSAQATIKVETPPKTIGNIQMPGAAVISMGDPCPQGWHKTSGSAGNAFTCAPKKPIQKIQCPPKTQYFETECAIGCQQMIY